MKTLRITFLAFWLIPFILFSQPSLKYGEQGDGTYCNPVLPSDYSDIDDIRVRTDFYAISSTFQYSPGVVVLHSKDLVNWEILSHIVDDITIMSTELIWTR
ncbi:MAG TPA: family 43 glycosylhydrolase [Paludibacter sp.]